MTGLPAGVRIHPVSTGAVVAIPACNEAAAIEQCLAALATQRDGCGAPVPAGAFEILLYANNCEDATVAVARAFAAVCPHPIRVVEARHEPARATAGWARKVAMDLAADRLEAGHDVVLTTDADSTVSPTWFAANLEAFVAGVDCVAGYIDADPAEFMRLGPRFVGRGRLEDRYLRLMAEIYALCDPRAHDPWPNHRVSSGASLAVTLDAYRAVGGLPTVPLGEDIAFTRRLEAAGFGVRRPMSVQVCTSCRFDGRAKGGAGDTMRLRHTVDDAPCDDEIEPARAVFRRARCRGALRRAHADGLLAISAWTRRLGLTEEARQCMLEGPTSQAFDGLWQRIEAESPALTRRARLRPSGLPAQIERAEALLRRLRRIMPREPGAAPADRPRRPAADMPVAA